MGALYKGVCYPTTAQAQAEFCASFSITGTDSNGTVIEARCTVAGATTPTIRKFYNGVNPVTLTGYQYPSFSNCDHSGGTDLVNDWLLGSLVVVATIWGLRRLIELFSTPTDA